MLIYVESSSSSSSMMISEETIGRRRWCCCQIYGVSGKNTVSVVMPEGIAADLVIPQTTSDGVKNAMRSSHLFSPIPMMIEEPIHWMPNRKAFECSGIISPPPC